MSFLNNLFGESSGNAKPSFWKDIESEEDLAAAVQKSFEKKVVIFKHSTRCGISRMVLKNFEKEVAASDKDAEYYYLDLLRFRPISSQIEQDFGISHQSPQMIVLQNGKAVNNASHQAVSVDLV